MSWPTSSNKRQATVRVPMTDAEVCAVRDKAAELGIPIAQLVRRCVFGVEYEIESNVNPNRTIKPAVKVHWDKVRVVER